MLIKDLENSEAYQISLQVYKNLAPNTPDERLKSIARKSAMSLKFPQAPKLFVTKSEITSIEGDGVRVNFFTSSCYFNCKNCYNRKSQQYGYGEEYSQELENTFFEKLAMPFVSGVTFIGGEPLQNAKQLLPLVEHIKTHYPEKTIWSYTGYIMELLLTLDPTDPKAKFLRHVDVLIDGQFIQEERNEKELYAYRGSSNQRLVDVQKSITQNKVILHESHDKKERG